MMKCDNCPFLEECVVGGEHLVVEVNNCPLYKAVRSEFEKYNENSDNSDV